MWPPCTAPAQVRVWPLCTAPGNTLHCTSQAMYSPLPAIMPHLPHLGRDRGYVGLSHTIGTPAWVGHGGRRSNYNYLVSKSILPWLQRTVQSPKLGKMVWGTSFYDYICMFPIQPQVGGVGHIIDRRIYICKTCGVSEPWKQEIMSPLGRSVTPYFLQCSTHNILL